MNWGAHEVDGRIAAKAAVKIRAALRQSIDAKRVYQLYKESDPVITDNEAQDNARARAWAMLNVRPNNNALITAIQFVWATGFVLGEDSAKEAIRLAREAKKALDSGVNWDEWEPGDRATALLIEPPSAFRRLLEKQGVAIKGLDKTAYDRIGTALSRSVRLGLGDTSAAKEINNAIGDPARALTIAITETNRAVSLGAIKTYRDAKLEKMEWAVSDPCPECAQNSGQVIDIGGTFNSGAQQPPAHPHCRCAILPVIPDYETNEAGVVDVAPSAPGVVVGSPKEIYAHEAGSWSKPLKGAEARAAINNRRRALQEIAQGTRYTDEQWALFSQSKSLEFAIVDEKLVRGHTLFDRGTTLVLVPDKTLKTLRSPVEDYLFALDKLQATDPVEGLTVWLSTRKLREWKKNPETTFAAATRGGQTAKMPEMAVNPEKTFNEPYDKRSKMSVDPATSQITYSMTHEWGHLTEPWTGDTTEFSAWLAGLKMNDKEIQALIEKSYGDVWGGSLMSRYGNSHPAEAYAEAFVAWRLGERKNPLVLAFAERFGWK